MTVVTPPEKGEVAAVSFHGLLNAPNLLSATRLPLGMLFWYIVDYPILAVGLLLLAGLTDMLDGLVARHQHRNSQVGAVIDPIFDKLFVLLVVGALVYHDRIDLRQLVLLTTRDWLIVPLTLGTWLLDARTRARMTFRSNYFGKATTVAQFFALVAALLMPATLPPLVLLAAGLGLICVVAYSARAFREAFGAHAASSV